MNLITVLINFVYETAGKRKRETKDEEARGTE